MKIKFNHFERVAGLFVLTAIVGTLVSGVFVAIKKGWFDRKVDLQTVFESAGGLTPGTQVQMSGLKIGSVDSVDLVGDNQILVKFTVPAKHLSKIREDSVVRTIRPFLIGDKVLDVSVGSPSSPEIKPGGSLKSEHSMDIMDILGGRQLGTTINELSSVMSSLKTVLQAFADPKRAQVLIDIFDQLLPLLTNANQMAQEVTVLGKQATRKKNLQKIVENLVTVTETLDDAMPQISEAVKTSPHLAKDMAAIVENLSKLTTELNKVLPALAEVAPDLPHASRRAIEAMDEAVIVLKAMQRSFLLKGSVGDVREEEAAAKKEREAAEKERMPADEQK